MSQQKRADWVRLAQSPAHIERIEAFFGGHGYEPHRHDTYAIGQTLSGVQRFHYRGGLQHSLPGGTMVLHPDEVHDGEAGTEEGFRYRMVYIEPAWAAISARLSPASIRWRQNSRRLIIT